MPLPGLFSAYYWPGDGQVNAAPPAATPNYDHPWYFDGTVVGMGLVGPRLTPRARKRIRGWLIQKIWRRVPLRLIASVEALRLIWSPEFGDASRVVRQVAQDPSSRDLNTWGDYARVQISEPAQSENVFRNFTARLILKHRNSGPLIELAWLAWKRRGR